MQGSDKQLAVLVVEANRGAAARWEEALAEFGCALSLCSQAESALDQAERTFFDLAFIADQVGKESGLDLLIELRQLFPDTQVVVAAAKPKVAEAVEAMRLGAFSYIGKPRRPRDLQEVFDDFYELRRLTNHESRRRQELSHKYDVHNLVGKSRPMQEVFRLIHKVAPTDATVLLLGESGTGKELVARAIHHHSDRRDRLLVPVNCGAIPHELLESELFGHEKGAFTSAVKTRLGRFELAEGGTVFLDEIGDMSPMLQVKLLRVLQEHKFERVGGTKTINADIRVIAATNQDLVRQVEEGKFREDLYYRLNVVPITIPPLRERKSDIPLLCQHFLTRLAKLKGMKQKKLSPEVKDCFMRYHWPGNVRELENLLERMMILAEGDTLTLDDLPPHLAGSALEGPLPAPAGALHTVEVPEEGLDFNHTVDQFERGLILQALERTGWVKNQAAALLNLNRTTLVEKIKKKGLAPPPDRGKA